ncbi:MAG: YkvA family protein [Telluria sp.]
MTEEFDDAGFWTKVKKFARTAGKEVVEKCLWLYYAAKQPGTPAWAKTAIYGALAYFVFPLDAVPDFIPVAGYTDDLGVLVTALGTVALYVTDEVKQIARDKMAGWFD